MCHILVILIYLQLYPSQMIMMIISVVVEGYASAKGFICKGFEMCICQMYLSKASRKLTFGKLITFTLCAMYFKYTTSLFPIVVLKVLHYTVAFISYIFNEIDCG